MRRVSLALALVSAAVFGCAGGKKPGGEILERRPVKGGEGQEIAFLDGQAVGRTVDLEIGRAHV